MSTYVPIPEYAKEVRGWEPVEEREGMRALTVALTGAPNAGKSTLLNALVQQKVAAETPKRNTTNRMAMGVYSDVVHGVQLVFLDTPGVPPAPLDRMSETSVAGEALASADVAALVLDASRVLTEEDVALHQGWMEYCASQSMEAFVVLTKADRLWSRSRERREWRTRGIRRPKTAKERVRERTTVILDVLERAAFDVGLLDAQGWDALPGPSRVHVVSGKHGEGIGEFRAALSALSIRRPWEFRPDVVTDLPLAERILEIVREKLFKNLHKNAPYTIQQETRSWDESPTLLHIHHDIIVPTRGVLNMLTGRSGATLRAVASAAERDLTKIVRKPVTLSLHVTISKSSG